MPVSLLLKPLPPDPFTLSTTAQETIRRQRGRGGTVYLSSYHLSLSLSLSTRRKWEKVRCLSPYKLKQHYLSRLGDLINRKVIPSLPSSYRYTRRYILLPPNTPFNTLILLALPLKGNIQIYHSPPITPFHTLILSSYPYRYTRR